jgi:hypothetical protein
MWEVQMKGCDKGSESDGQRNNWTSEKYTWKDALGCDAKSFTIRAGDSDGL